MKLTKGDANMQPHPASTVQRILFGNEELIWESLLHFDAESILHIPPSNSLQEDLSAWAHESNFA